MSRGPAIGSRQIPTKVCPTCGDAFFTQVGLDEHMRRGQHDGMIRRWVGGVSPVLRETGRRVAALNNGRRRRCKGCDLATTCAALGVHQKATGHSGWTEVR